MNRAVDLRASAGPVKWLLRARYGLTIIAILVGTIPNLLLALCFWPLFYLLSRFKWVNCRVKDWNSETQWRITRGFSIGIGYFILLSVIICVVGQFDFITCDIINAFLIFFIVCVSVAALSRPLLDKIMLKSLIFCVILVIGFVAYLKVYSMPKEKREHNCTTCEKKLSANQNPAVGKSGNSNKSDRKWSKNYARSMAMVSSAVASFFPSRGEYERNINDNDCLWYFFFHLCCYIFFGYFAMALFGQRIINRMRFALVPSFNKYFIWCKDKISVQELNLAQTINARSDNEFVCFSVAEETYSEGAKELFMEMNYRLFGVKLRKRGQIHKDALVIPEHFFISDDTAWNLNMLKQFVDKRKTWIENGHVLPPAKLYIRIEGDLEYACEHYRTVLEEKRELAIKLVFVLRRDLVRHHCEKLIRENDKNLNGKHIYITFSEWRREEGCSR